jgi:hypothetical protein
MRNPFRYGGIVTGEYFADRTDEIEERQREIEKNRGGPCRTAASLYRQTG